MEHAKLYMDAICSVGKLVNALTGEEHDVVFEAYALLLNAYKKK